MNRIRKLNPALVNKIAAGEVIERPASVVKELVENALDAGATRVDITLEDGGATLIRITDNGHGIPPDDLPLAVAQHATSKIYSDEDLFNVRSLGFRGEALASIAAVSHLRICSRPAGQLEAYELRDSPTTDPASPGSSPLPQSDPAVSVNPQSEIRNPQSLVPGDLPNAGRLLRPCAAPLGTSIEVRHLFFNLPARRKFLRQPGTELSHITEQLARLALPHPRVAFSLAHNGRQARNLPVTNDRRQRIADFYGAELAECLIPVDRQERGLRIEAFIAPPDQSRGSAKWQHLFLNGRFIMDRRLSYAVREAFRGLIEHDRFPVVFIFLTTDPGQFDVNVHPTKIEVRWRDAGLVQSQVLAVLRETLLSHDLTPRLRARPDLDDAVAPPHSLHQQRARQALADYLKSIDPTQARIEFRPPRFPTHALRPSIASTFVQPFEEQARLSAPTHAEPSPPDRADEYFGDKTGPLSAWTADAPAHPTDSSPAHAIAAGPAADPAAYPAQDSTSQSDRGTHYLASFIQVHNTYIVAQTDDGIIIVDQHALHERILYEKFRQRILAGPLESQRLLVPQTLQASPVQARIAQEHEPLLRKIGIEIAPFGPTTLAVQSFPSLLHHVEPTTFVADLLDKLAETSHLGDPEALLHTALDAMACKAAVKAGDVLSPEEIEVLLAHRHLTERPSSCPHGRPTTLQLTTRDLEKQFKRV